MLVDSHCHLDDAAFDQDREQVIERAREAGVSFLLAIGTGDGPPDLEAAIRLAEARPDMAATVGVHPHHADRFDPTTARRLERLCERPEVWAIGEIGLDYRHDNAPRETQRRSFVAQLEIAAAAGLPISIHTRFAWDDTLDLLRRHWAGRGPGGIMHCFTGTSDQALQCLELGFLLSFSGILTFPRSAALRDTARWTPLDRTLVETDAPYLTPAPHRKIRRNEPRFVVETARALAAAQGVAFEEVARQTTANFRRLFRLEEVGQGSAAT